MECYSRCCWSIRRYAQNGSTTIDMECKLFGYQTLNQIKATGFNKRYEDLSEPAVIGRYAFKLVGKERSLVANPDDFVLQYAPIELKEGETLDLRVTEHEEIQDRDEILKSDGTLGVFLQHIVNQRDVQMYKSNLEESFSELTLKGKKSRTLNVDFVTLRAVLCNLM